jgi:VanZ family protein
MPTGPALTLPRAVVLAWIAVTLGLATSLGSASNTGGLLAPLLASVGLTGEGATLVHVLLRKAGHVLAYAGFALLARASLRGPGRARRALLLALALALADEAVQSVSARRGGSPLDVLLDVGAAALALAWVERRAALRAAGGR